MITHMKMSLSVDSTEGSAVVDLPVNDRVVNDLGIRFRISREC